MGISTPNIWDIECCDGELTMVYDAAQIRRICEALDVQPNDLLDCHTDEPVITGEILAACIVEHCKSHGINVEQFEDAAGWCVAASLEDPTKFYTEYSIDGIRDVCRALGLDWRRFIVGLVSGGAER